MVKTEMKRTQGAGGSHIAPHGNGRAGARALTFARSGRSASPSQEDGFTLVELMIVMLIIGILAAIAIPSFTASIRNAREATLREDLQVMREAIDSFTMDKEKAPQSLDELTQSGYLKVIPKDPMTQSDATWVTDTDDSVESVDQTAGGISNIHSGSGQTGTDGKPYSEW